MGMLGQVNCACAIEGAVTARPAAAVNSDRLLVFIVNLSPDSRD
jgi:hypothetical protein